MQAEEKKPKPENQPENPEKDEKKPGEKIEKSASQLRQERKKSAFFAALEKAARRTHNETVMEIASLLNLLGDDFRDLFSLHGVVSLSLLKPYLTEPTIPRLPPVVLPAPSSDLLSRERLAKDLRMMTFASAIYGPMFLYYFAGEQYSKLTAFKHVLREGVLSSSLYLEAFQKHTGIPQEKVLVHDFLESSLSGDRPHCIAVDADLGAVVWTVRGTMNITDAITDAIASYVPFSVKFPEIAPDGLQAVFLPEFEPLKPTFMRGDTAPAERAPLAEEAGWRVLRGLAHKGMLQSARHMFDVYFERVRNIMSAHKLSKLYITGHSLGAGVTALLTMLCVEPMRRANLTVEGFAFACPSVASLNLGVASSPYLRSFGFGKDIIPRLSIGSVQDLHQLVVRKKTESTLIDKSMSILVGAMPRQLQLPEKFLIPKRVLETLFTPKSDGRPFEPLTPEQRAAKLYVPGCVIQLDPITVNGYDAPYAMAPSPHIELTHIMETAAPSDHHPSPVPFPYVVHPLVGAVPPSLAFLYPSSAATAGAAAAGSLGIERALSPPLSPPPTVSELVGSGGVLTWSSPLSPRSPASAVPVGSDDPADSLEIPPDIAAAAAAAAARSPFQPTSPQFTRPRSGSLPTNPPAAAAPAPPAPISPQAPQPSAWQQAWGTLASRLPLLHLTANNGAGAASGATASAVAGATGGAVAEAVSPRGPRERSPSEVISPRGPRATADRSPVPNIDGAPMEPRDKNHRGGRFVCSLIHPNYYAEILLTPDGPPHHIPYHYENALRHLVGAVRYDEAPLVVSAAGRPGALVARRPSLAEGPSAGPAPDVRVAASVVVPAVFASATVAAAPVVAATTAAAAAATAVEAAEEVAPSREEMTSPPPTLRASAREVARS